MGPSEKERSSALGPMNTTGRPVFPLLRRTVLKRCSLCATRCAIVFLCVLLILPFLSCCTSLSRGALPSLISHKERMFWEIRGPQGSVYILGTISVGSEKLLHFQDKILDVFDSASRLYAELGSEDIKNFASVLQRRMLHGMLEQENAAPTLSSLSREELEMLRSTLGDDMHTLSRFEPWVMRVALYQALIAHTKLDSGKNIEAFLYQCAGNRKILGLDSIQKHLNMLSFGNREEQITLLRALIALGKSPADFKGRLGALVRSYLSNDKTALGRVSTELDALVTKDAAGGLHRRYVAEIAASRRAAWAEEFYRLSLQHGITFVFASAGHFCGPESVFDIMRKRRLLQ